MKPTHQISFARFLRLVLALFVTMNASGATFTDNNWISMGGILGANDWVAAAATDDSGNLYLGGAFTIVGDAAAYGIAKWDGTRWSALGSGLSLNGVVNAIAVSGTNVYVAGSFATAGGITVTNIAKWDGSN